MPVQKNGNKRNAKNYHPVSLLSAFAKVLETVMLTNVSFFFKCKISICQHSFVQGRSVETRVVFLDSEHSAVAN